MAEKNTENNLKITEIIENKKTIGKRESSSKL